MPSFDPRQPEVLEWISLRPEAELVMRMALREVFAHYRHDRGWTARIEELMAELDLDEETLARILLEYDKTVKMIRETV